MGVDMMGSHGRESAVGRMSRRVRRGGVVSGAAVVVTGLTILGGSWEPAEASGPVKDDSLQIGVDAPSVQLSWLARSSASPVVQYAVRPRDGRWPARVVTVPAAGRATSEPGWRGAATSLRGLKPGTTYLYRVGSVRGGWSPVRTYQVPPTPKPGEAQTFLAFGDPQLARRGTSVRGAAGWASTLATATAKFPRSRFLFSLGDQVNDARSAAEWDAFYAPAALAGRRLAGVPGNHDVGHRSQAYWQHVSLPSPSTAGDWSTVEGDTLIVGLNSNEKRVAVHSGFLAKAVAANPTVPWTVVAMHHAPFSGADHMDDDDVRRFRAELTPVFSRLGVDLVLSGHDHSYVRTHLMRGATVSTRLGGPGALARPRAGEVLYLTLNSASGSKFYDLEGVRPWEAVRSQTQRPSYTAVTTGSGRLTATTYDDRGRRIDAVTLRH